MHIGHAHLKVRDLDRAAAFYERYLDMRVRERIGNGYVFMSGGEVHHEIALQRVPADARLPGRHDVGLFHVAFEVPDKRQFGEAFHRLASGGIPVALVDHRISWAMYFSDPDGNGLEIYCDTRDAADGAVEWEGHDRPLTVARVMEAAGR